MDQDTAATESGLFDNTRYMSTEEVAEYLRTPVSTVRSWVHRGKLKPALRIFGRRLLFERDYVMKIVDEFRLG